MKRIRTYMSPVFFRVFGEGLPQPLIAGGQQRCLMDDLLGGGIAIPDSIVESMATSHPAHALVGLLVGRPGSGKSTFAMELCYRLSENANEELGPLGRTGLSSLYVSAESDTATLIEQARQFGWDNGDIKRIIPWSEDAAPALPRVFVYGRDLFAQNAITDPGSFFKHVMSKWPKIDAIEPHQPRIVVFDSFNIFEEKWKAEEILAGLYAHCTQGKLLVLAMLDSHYESPSYDRWDHIADIILDLSYRKEKDYLIRCLQVVKGRYQDHADGEHRLKINARPMPEEEVRHPMSPFIREGGIFAFPSIHRTLSKARRSSPPQLRFTSPSGTISAPFQQMNAIMGGGGFPAGKCTAIVGSRGGMKSHLTYYTLLKFLMDHRDQRALLISLRDEEDAAQRTLAEILCRQRTDEGEPFAPSFGDMQKSSKLINELIHSHRLEVLFFYPGYISPEEFFHLTQVAVDSAPNGRREVSLVVLNSLEQLSARFPLCAREDMFVSGLITMFNVCGTTSLVTAGGSPTAPADQGGVTPGLLQMSDLIIESSFALLPKDRVWSTDLWPQDRDWQQVLQKKQYQQSTRDPQEEPHVVYQIIREPGSRECRKRALFYMGREDDTKPLWPGSVVVRPLPDNFPYGDRNF
jgi:KaiC/GvpD/RAD55 family RecA-like ATPase